MRYTNVNLTEMADEIVEELRNGNDKQAVTFVRGEHVVVNGDHDLLRVLLENLLGNAWKYSGKKDNPSVELGVHNRNGDQVYFVRDNGAGFDMKYVDKLFSPFQRLHSDSEFYGLGIGLATVARIVHRHGGEIWAEAQVDQGATFYFTLAPSVNE